MTLYVDPTRPPGTLGDGLLDVVLSRLREGVILTDPGGQVRYVNAEAQRILGPDVGRHPLLGQGEPGVLGLDEQPLPRERLPLRRVLDRKEELFGQRLLLLNDSGQRVVIEVDARPLLGPDKADLGSIMTLRDVTELHVQTEQRQEHLAALVHDLKSPLTVLLGTAQSLSRRVQQGGEVSRDLMLDSLERIERTTGRMARLTDEFLDIATLRAGKPLALNRRTLNLVDLVSQVVDDQRHVIGHRELILETDSSSRVGTWDADRLERVLANLLSNAVKYSPDDSEIIVTVGEEETPEGGVAFVRIQDQGIGITREDLPYVFDRFRRGQNVGRAHEGTGIGLYGSRQIVEQHAGTIDVVETGPAGTTFVIRLPLDAPGLIP